MSTIILAFFAGAAVGGCVAALWLLHLMERRAKRYKEAEVTLSFTPDVVNTVGARLMLDFMERHGLVLVTPEGETKTPRQVLH